MTPRIVAIQHGDYAAARRHLLSGGDETYGGQKYSIESIERLLLGSPHLILSLDGARYREEVEGLATFINLPPAGRVCRPRRWYEHRRGTKILKKLASFEPTHVLLRTNDVIGCQVLEWVNARRMPTAVIVAARFDPTQFYSREFCRLANSPNVIFVANHNRVATASMIECGLIAEKSISWDYPPTVRPDTPIKTGQPAPGPLSLVFAGSVVRSKGVLDAVQAVQLVQETGLKMRLSVCGDGPLLASLRRHRGCREGWLELTGRIASQAVLERMKAGWAVVVPTRVEFPEALPLVILEALSTRTPIIMSDHPVFRQYFVQNEGVRFFQAADASGLARVLIALANDPMGYAHLSEKTLETWERLQIDCRMHDLFDKFAHETGIRAP